MTTSTDQFFDLHVSGIGYVNRIRLVPIKRGNPFWACDISALNGASDNVEYRRFDCRVNGSVAESLIKKLHTTVTDRKQKGMAEPKILINFKLGDLYADLYTRTKGERAGEQGVSMKARLLFINWIKIDNEKVYEAPKRNEIFSESNPTLPDEGPDSDIPQSTQPAALGSVGAAEAFA